MHNSRSRWTLVTVTHNSSKVLAEFWSSFPSNQAAKWIVVDNNSTDDSAKIAEGLGAHVIRNHKNLGFSRANNIGFDLAATDYVAFVNPDVAVDYNSLDYLANIIDQTGGLVAPQLVNNDGSMQPNGRGWPVLAHKILNRLWPRRVEGRYRIIVHPGEIKEVPWFTGAVVAGSRKTLERLGPWDSYFFVYYEDTDLCLRARKLEIPSLVTGDIRWKHGWARATAKFNKNFFKSWKLELGSMVKFYLRYPQLLIKKPSGESNFATHSSKDLELNKYENFN